MSATLEEMQFSTKANNLSLLKDRLKTAQILPIYVISALQWTENKETISKNLIGKKWNTCKIIVRSSSSSEDSYKESLAGHFDSKIADYSSESDIVEAIDAVLSSYSNVNEADQIFCQPYLDCVKECGVIFSKKQDTNSPYILINYDNHSRTTDSITSGCMNGKIFCIFRDAPNNILETIPEPFKRLRSLTYELESLFNYDSIDIEYAITENDKLFLLQVRPLVINNHECKTTTSEIKESHVLIDQKVKELNHSTNNVLGDKYIYGIMPDWNPAEIIGVRPTPLAMSLYRELVTDSIWAYQRYKYGYRDLRSVPLMYDFGGLPYIDVRASLNSFIPNNLESDIASKLVKFYTQKLINNHHLHDKIEFEIIFSCFSFDLDERLEELLDNGFTKLEFSKIKKCLIDLTNKIIDPEKGIWKDDLAKHLELDKNYQALKNSQLGTIDRIYWLIEDCKRYGTLPFAGLARVGFIAAQLLKSLNSLNILNNNEYNTFYASLQTVTKELTEDRKTLNQKSFLEKYGHLRPGTYDILSYRYDEDYERYFKDQNSIPETNTSTKEEFKISINQLLKLRELIESNGLKYGEVELFSFIKQGIEGREKSKFLFTRNLSDCISYIQQLGKDNGFSKEEMSFADIKDLLNLKFTTCNIKELIQESISKGRKRYSLTQKTILPPLISSEEDIWYFHQDDSKANFITDKKITSSITHHSSPESLSEKIVLIPNADPGFDWIFTRNILGLITAHGGVNSHMAIRAGELQIPSAIGVGETFFNKLMNHDIICLDCSNEIIHLIE